MYINTPEAHVNTPSLLIPSRNILKTNMPEFNKINLLSFNVEGLDSILLDPSFFSLINSHDISFLTETMRKDETKLNLPGFWDHSLIRKKDEKTPGRYSGGITVLVKENLRVGVKIAHKSEGLLWIRLDKSFFHFQRDL